MSEEMNRHEAKLNDATLEGVSGGSADELARRWARALCSACCYADLSRLECQHSHQKDLLYHFGESGNISNYTECPYYNR